LPVWGLIGPPEAKKAGARNRGVLGRGRVRRGTGKGTGAENSHGFGGGTARDERFFRSWGWGGGEEDKSFSGLGPRKIERVGGMVKMRGSLLQKKKYFMGAKKI